MWQGGRSWSCPSNAHSSLVLLCELAVMSCLKVVFTKDINKDVTQSHILCPTSAHELPAGGFTTGLEQDPTHQQHPPSTSLCLSSSSSVFREQGILWLFRWGNHGNSCFQCEKCSRVVPDQKELFLYLLGRGRVEVNR